MNKQTVAEKVIYDSRAPIEDRNEALVIVRSQAARIAELESNQSALLNQHANDTRAIAESLIEIFNLKEALADVMDLALKDGWSREDTKKWDEAHDLLNGGAS